MSRFPSLPAGTVLSDQQVIVRLANSDHSLKDTMSTRAALVEAGVYAHHWSGWHDDAAVVAVAEKARKRRREINRASIFVSVSIGLVSLYALSPTDAQATALPAWMHQPAIEPQTGLLGLLTAILVGAVIAIRSWSKPEPVELANDNVRTLEERAREWEGQA